MKTPLLLINDSEQATDLRVAEPERFEPLLLLSRERAHSDWNFVSPDGSRIGYYCVSEWSPRGFETVLDFDRISRLVAACGYGARHTVGKRYLVTEDNGKKWLDYLIDSSNYDIEEPIQLIYTHLRRVLGTEEFGTRVCFDEPAELIEFFGNERLSFAGWEMVNNEARFTIHYQELLSLQ